MNLRERVAAHFSSRLAVGDRPAPVRRDPPHRVRGDGRRDRRAAARSRAGQGAAARAQPRAAPQGRSRRARAAGDAGPPRFVRRGRRRAGATCRALRAVLVAARGARGAASPRRASTRCAGRALGLEQRERPVLRAAGAGAAPARASAPNRRPRTTRGSRAALAPHRDPAVAVRAAPALLRERDPLGGRTDVHVLRDWCWLGTAQRRAASSAALVDSAAAPGVRPRHRAPAAAHPRPRQASVDRTSGGAAGRQGLRPRGPTTTPAAAGRRARMGVGVRTSASGPAARARSPGCR